MGEFTHAMRNPIRERDERIAALEEYVARLKEREADLVRQNVALMGQNGRLQGEVEKLKSPTSEPDEKARTLHTNAADYMKCASRDCWLCHGTPENAGPR
jgi:hypothetical protein